MSKSDTMARLPGLFERDGVYHLRVMIPLDLQTAYGGRTKVVESLRTRVLNDAKEAGTARRAAWLTEFGQKRRQSTLQKVERVTPELGKMLAERVTAAMMEADAALRNDPRSAQVLLSAVQALKPPSNLRIGRAAAPPSGSTLRAPADPLDGLGKELAAELAEANRGINLYAAEQMALQRVASILPTVKAQARELGIEFDEKAPGAMDALRECLRAYRKAWQDISRRDEGEVIDTPPASSRPAVALATAPTTLRDVYPQWKASKARKRQTLQAAEKALTLYEAATGNPPIASLTRAQGVEMRAYLLKSGITTKTARDRFDYIKGFLNFASRELELLPRNPWSGLAIEYSTANPRRPWSGEQLAALFALPLFTKYELPSAWDAGGDAAYWVPLLGIFTGARISELCQLRIADVQTIDTVPVLRITDEAEGQTIKTEAGRRTVPVHPELIRLGFLQYVEALRKAGAERLFPALRLAKDKPGSYFSQWFSANRKQVELNLPDFHSMRHTVRSKLASAGVAEPMIDTLIGHEVKGSTGARTYTMRSTEDLKRAISSLRYPGLELSPVYEVPKRTSLKTGPGSRATTVAAANLSSAAKTGRAPT